MIRILRTSCVDFDVSLPRLNLNMISESIFRAAERGDLDTVKHYLERRNVSSEVKQKIGCIVARHDNINLLEHAVKGHPEIVDSVFRYAVRYGALNATRYLVETHNANILSSEYPEESDKRASATAVDIAVENGRLNILKYFLEERNINIDEIPATSRGPLLFRAVRNRRGHIVQYLVEERNASLTTLNYKGENILYTAARNGDLKFIKYVLDEKKADIDLDRRNKAGKTLLLTVTCSWNNYCIEIFEYLVEQKRVKIFGGENGYPLHCVRSARVCAYLLEHGYDVNEADKLGNTPLHQVLKRISKYNNDDERFIGEDVQIIEHLIERGAVINLPSTESGYTPLILPGRILADRNNYKIVRFSDARSIIDQERQHRNSRSLVAENDSGKQNGSAR